MIKVKRRKRQMPSFEKVARKILQGKEWFIVSEFYFHSTGRPKIESILGMSPEMVSKIHDNAILKIKKYLQDFEEHHKNLKAV